MSAQIDAAVKATVAKPVPMNQVTVTIASTGRQVIFAFPPDLSEAELVEYIGWLGSSLYPRLVAERTKGAASRIVIPVGMTVGGGKA